MHIIQGIRRRLPLSCETLPDTAAILILWAFIFLFVPTLVSRPTVVFNDSPVFYSVWHQLIHGSRLYADVFDHKDPVFYYSYALFFSFYGARGPMLWETLISLGDAVLMVRIMRRANLRFIGRFVVAAVFTGLTFLPAVYFPLHTYQQTIFFFLLSLALILGEGNYRPFFTGVCGVLMTFSRVTAVIFVPLFLGMAALQPPARRVKSVIGYFAGFAGGCSFLLVGMFFRGELSGYLDAIRLNLHYPTLMPLTEKDVITFPSLWAHVDALFPHAIILMGLLLFGANLLILANARKQHSQSTTASRADDILRPKSPELSAVISQPISQGERSDAFYSLVSIYLTVSVTSILFAASFWDHYYQIVGLAVSFSMVPVLRSTKSLRFHFIQVSDALALVLMGVFVASGMFRTFSRTDLELANIPPTKDAVRQDVLEYLQQRYDGRQVSFAVLEQNRNAWILAATPPAMQFRCRLFFQYPYFPTDLLVKFTDCLERSNVDVIFQSAYPVKMGPDFNRSIRKLLAEKYVRTVKMGPFRLWEKQ